jgi:hypothetical protein
VPPPPRRLATILHKSRKMKNLRVGERTVADSLCSISACRILQDYREPRSKYSCPTE